MKIIMRAYKLSRILEQEIFNCDKNEIAFKSIPT